jgi:hypothetical protein
MSQGLNNPLLQATEEKLESGIQPETRQAYDKIVVAGLHAALDKGPDGILASLKLSKDPIADAAKGAISLVLILRKQAHGVMPHNAMVFAAMTLMLRALDFADRAGIVKVDQPALVRATHIFTDVMFARFGIAKQGLQNAAEKVHAITQDPAKMAAINLKAGVTAHPGAAPPPAPGLMNGGGA